MIRLVNHDATLTAGRVRHELAALRERLRAAAEEGSRHAARSSHRARRMAGHRARLAAQRLRGGQTGVPWRWLWVGLGVGVVAGAVGAAAVRRWRAAEPEQVTATPAVAALRERGIAVANRAAHSAWETVARARRATGRATAGEESDTTEWTAESGGTPDRSRPRMDPDPDATSQ